VSSSAAIAFARVQGVRADQIAEGALMAATMENGGRLCLGRFQGALFAVKDSCPHNEYPLSEGTLYPDGKLECCWHGATFDCRSGKVLQGPAEVGLVRYEVMEKDGAVFARRLVTEN
jgi:3-phenylpropionate/trans-cinnamate dioxygenase ferredoxin subunit